MPFPLSTEDMKDTLLSYLIETLDFFLLKKLKVNLISLTHDGHRAS